ncbi:type II toxin-antitoxin system mRNA interferase toxin, RelE/StbE family [Candidatus Parcubacteria bacterium]|nr:type II toxin-antitoxin system mRNA interferase toxin, RelE/StbE family [Candidatus Parcubacteria bacterium]
MTGRIKNIEYSKKFIKSLKKLPKRVVEQTEQKEKIFKENCFNFQLKTHKLKGGQQHSWAFWINDSYRVKFIFISSDEVLFLNIGTHEIYK